MNVCNYRFVLTVKDGEEEEEEVKVEVKQEEEDKFNWDSASMMPDVIATRAKVIIHFCYLFLTNSVFCWTSYGQARV